MTAHIPEERVLFILALAPDDPERESALEHAAGCETCAALLAGNEPLLSLLDEGLAELPALDPALGRRVQAALQPRAARWSWLWLALGGVVTLCLGWFALHHTEPRPQHSGLRCFLFEQGFAALAFGLGALYVRRNAVRLPALQWASMAMGGALAGQALLLLRCNANGAALHILLAHVLGVACATALGALIGVRLRPTRTA